MATRQSNIKVNVVGDASDFRAALNKSEAGLRGFDKQLSTMNKSLNSIKWSVFAAKAVAFGYAMQKVGRAIWDLAQAGAEYNDTLSKIDAIYGKQSRSVQTWARESNAALVSTERTVLDTVSSFDLMFRNLGLTDKEAQKLARTMTNLAADLASFYGGNYEESSAALQAAYRGEYEQLEKYNIFLSAAKVEQEAVRLGLIKHGEALDDNSKLLAINSLVMKQSSDAQGDLERTMGSAANQIKALSANLQDLKEKYGAALSPLIERFLPDINALLEDLGSDENIDAFGAKVEAFGDYIESTLVPAIRDFWRELRGVDWAVVGGRIEELGRLLKEVYDGLTPIREAMQFIWETFNSLPAGIKEFLILLAGLKWLAGGAILRIAITGPAAALSRLIGGRTPTALGNEVTNDVVDRVYVDTRDKQDRAYAKAQTESLSASLLTRLKTTEAKLTEQRAAGDRAIHALLDKEGIQRKAGDTKLTAELAARTTGGSTWKRIVGHVPIIGDLALLGVDLVLLRNLWVNGDVPRTDWVTSEIVKAKGASIQTANAFTRTGLINMRTYSDKADNQITVWTEQWNKTHIRNNESTQRFARLKVEEEAAVRATGDKKLIREYERQYKLIAKQARVDDRLDRSIRGEISNRRAGDAEDRARINAERIARINRDGALNAKDQSLQYQVNQLKRGFAILPGTNKPVPVTLNRMSASPRSETQSTTAAYTSGGVTININTLVADRNVGRQVVKAIQEYEYSAGTTWRNR